VQAALKQLKHAFQCGTLSVKQG